MTEFTQGQLVVDATQVEKLVELLKGADIPSEDERGTMVRASRLDLKELANVYFAIVAICHQTSPLGERPLEGYVTGDPYSKRVGWDYLKERFVARASQDGRLTVPSWWSVTPAELSDLYDDAVYGKTLNRITERTHLLNDLGIRLEEQGVQCIEELYHACGDTLAGEGGFLNRLEQFEAYRDPVRKKSLYFLSIMATECSWHISDPENLLSPVDYHELRGHLRIGTVVPVEALLRKIRVGVPLSAEEDNELRAVVQRINTQIAAQLGISGSRLHYLLWNVFRNCCPRDAFKTHCQSCGGMCGLPASYKAMAVYHGRCIFSAFCVSAEQERKVVDPPYLGNFY